MYRVSFSKTDTRESNMWEWDSIYSGFYFPKCKLKNPTCGSPVKKINSQLYWFHFPKWTTKEFHSLGSSCTGFHVPKRTKKDISWSSCCDFIFTNNQGWSMRTITKEEHFSVRRKSMKVEANLSARLNYFRNHRHLFALGIKQKMGIHLYWVSFSKTDNHEFHTWESSCTGFHFPKRTNQDIS